MDRTSSTPFHQNLASGLRQSPGIEIVEDGGSIADIQPPSSTTQSRELSRNSTDKVLMKRCTSNLPANIPMTIIPEVITTPQISIPSQKEPITMIQLPSNTAIPFVSPSLTPKVDEITLVPGRGQELQTTLGTVMVPASQKGHPKITHVKDVEYQGKKTHVFVITMEEDDESMKK